MYRHKIKCKFSETLSLYLSPPDGQTPQDYASSKTPGGDTHGSGLKVPIRVSVLPTGGPCTVLPLCVSTHTPSRETHV